MFQTTNQYFKRTFETVDQHIHMYTMIYKHQTFAEPLLLQLQLATYIDPASHLFPRRGASSASASDLCGRLQHLERLQAQHCAGSSGSNK